MGFVKAIYLYCNGNSPKCICWEGNEALEAEGMYETITRYRKDMKAQGWIFRSNNKAYCPECAKELKCPSIEPNT